MKLPVTNEDLRTWFRQKWVRMDTKGNIKGDCAREEGEGKPKCLPSAQAHSMSKEDRAAAARRKRREDPVADRPGKGGKPINVRTEEMDLEEANKPTNPALWSRAKALAKSKFDVYPSAYANGWAAKWYKSKGGGWKSVSEGVDDEGGMAKGELETIASKAKTLSKMMKKNKQLDAWVQSKITKADDYIGSVHDYLKNGKQEVDEQMQKKTFFKLREQLDSVCIDCDDSIYGSVEEDFEPTGEEQYEDWDLEEAQTPLQFILKNPGKEYPPFDPDPPKKNKPAGDEAKHGGMSRAKHLAQMMKNKMNKMDEDWDLEEGSKSETEGMVSYIHHIIKNHVYPRAGDKETYIKHVAKHMPTVVKSNPKLFRRAHSIAYDRFFHVDKNDDYDHTDHSMRQGEMGHRKGMSEAKDTDKYTYIDQSGGQVIKGKSGTYVGYTHSATKGKGANILKHNNTKKYYAAGGSSTAFTQKTTLHDTPEDAARAYHKGNLAEAIKKPNATTRHLRDYPVSDKDVAKPVKKPEKKKPEQGVVEASSLAQQAAIAIAMKKAGKKPKDVSEETLEEAEKNGKRVQLNKPFRTSDGKGKFAVYTKNDKGNVVKVNFGDTTGLTIKTSNPDRRRSFRARHNCDTPGPRHKARYWSCRAWSRGTVSAGLGT